MKFNLGSLTDSVNTSAVPASFTTQLSGSCLNLKGEAMDNLCGKDEQLDRILAAPQSQFTIEERIERMKRDKRNAARRAKHAAYTDLGLKRVRGALGGVYYE